MIADWSEFFCHSAVLAFLAITTKAQVPREPHGPDFNYHTTLLLKNLSQFIDVFESRGIIVNR